MRLPISRSRSNTQNARLVKPPIYPLALKLTILLLGIGLVFGSDSQIYSSIGIVGVARAESTLSVLENLNVPMPGMGTRSTTESSSGWIYGASGQAQPTDHIGLSPGPVEVNIRRQETLQVVPPRIRFEDVTQASGLVDLLSDSYIHTSSWGDADGDGWLDLFVGTFVGSSYPDSGDPSAKPDPDRLLLYKNGVFQDSGQSDLAIHGRGAGSVFADLDNDGDLDLYISNNRKTAANEPSQTYSWILATVPAGSNAILTGSTGASSSFVADLAGFYAVELVVNDGTDDSAPDTLSITSGTGTNTPPVADAGPDQVIQVGATVNLDGSGSSDGGNDPLTFLWDLITVPVGSTASLTGPTTSNPSFLADLAGFYEVELVVNNGAVDSAPDTVTIIVSAGTANLLSDTFNRQDSSLVGDGWIEVEQAGATVSLAANQLFFDDTSDAANRPLARRNFSPVATGTLQWDFDFDWVRSGNEGTYRLLMQLGDRNLMSDESQNAGVGVNLIWTSINGTHQSLGYRQGGVNSALAVVSGPTLISVVAELDARIYSVAVNGSVVGTGIPFESSRPLNTVRFLTDGLNEGKFSGRTFDNVIVSSAG